VNFAIADAGWAVNNMCVKQGMGGMFYDNGTGRWRPDSGDRTLTVYLLKLADIYRSTWEGKTRHSGVLKMCGSLKKPSFMEREIAPLVKALLYKDSSLFDNDSYTINCQGIAVDLRTGKMRRAGPGDCFTKSTGFRPGNPDEAVRFRRFLLEVCRGDADKAAWVLRWFCRAASGKTLGPLEGSGGNGKSVIQNLFLKVYGGYGTVLLQELIIQGYRGEQ
jgi:phage/plasmid-associated DNA primase